MLARIWVKRDTHTLVVGLQIGATTLESRMAIPQNLGMETPLDPVIPLLGLYPKYLKSV